VERSFHQQRILKERGDQIHILRLQGYIFFGTAYPLLAHILARLESAQLPSVRFLLLDFHSVSGLDSSSVLSFNKIRQVCGANSVELHFVDLRQDIKVLLEEGGCLDIPSTENDSGSDDGSCRLFSDLDHAIAWCEEQILKEQEQENEMPQRSLEDLFSELFDQKELISQLRSYLEKIEAAAGYVLFKQGEDSDDLYFVETGEVTAFLELPDAKKTRLRTMGAGTVVGEMGLYLGRSRSATIVTEETSVLYRLSAESFGKMEAENGRLASSIHQFMVRLLANRLAHANEQIGNL
jgi:SulP family sulfate permease